MLDRLERRVLLAAVPANVITITGSGAVDNISFAVVNGLWRVTHNGAIRDYIPNLISKFVVKCGAGNDVVTASNSILEPFEIYGGADSDKLRGGGLADVIYGGDNSSSQKSENGVDSLYGGNGSDKLFAPKYGKAVALGENDNDILTGANLNDDFNGGAGNDSLVGNGADDILRGSSGDDVIDGGFGNDWCDGGSNNDKITGGWGNDTQYGGEGNDNLKGSQNHDFLDGGNGNDTAMGEDGIDTHVGGAGIDEISYVDRVTPVNVTLDNQQNDGGPGELDWVGLDFEVIRCGSGNDLVVGDASSETIYGGGGDDEIHGGSGNDYVSGSSGNDVLWGDAGTDQVLGFEGNDRLYGGANTDNLDGGEGNDIIVSIGGGQTDKALGGAGSDTFWTDAETGETTDASLTEKEAGMLHRVPFFFNDVSRDLDGQNLPDPLGEPDVPYYSNLFTGNPLFSTAGPQDIDIKQGGVGSCYFLAGLASVAVKYPEKIRQTIVDLGDDTYAVQYHMFGQQFFVRVDSQLAVTSVNSTTPAYAGLGKEKSMWVAIMEKAFCLIRNNSYSSINGGESKEAFDALGMHNESAIGPTMIFTMEFIDQQLNLGHAVAASTWNFPFVTGMPIVSGHVYQVQSVNTGEWLVTLRNPWGSDAGRAPGSYVDGDNDGVITISWTDFWDAFDEARWARV